MAETGVEATRVTGLSAWQIESLPAEGLVRHVRQALDARLPAPGS